MPDVTIVRPGMPFETNTPTQLDIIQFGDMLHVDFGVTALGLNTDTQHLAYVLHPGETEKDIPDGLLQGLRKVNRLQDIVVENMNVGMSGNDILSISLEEMRQSILADESTVIQLVTGDIQPVHS